jgi:chromosome segregation ATPase
VLKSLGTAQSRRQPVSGRLRLRNSVAGTYRDEHVMLRARIEDLEAELAAERRTIVVLRKRLCSATKQRERVGQHLAVAEAEIGGIRDKEAERYEQRTRDLEGELVELRSAGSMTSRPPSEEPMTVQQRVQCFAASALVLVVWLIAKACSG